MKHALERLVWPLVLVATAWGLAWMSVRDPSMIPAGVLGTLPWWPALTTVAAMILATAFGQGRLAFAALAYLIAAEAWRQQTSDPIGLAVAFLLPLNLAICVSWRERRIFSEAGVLRLFFLVFQVVVVLRLSATRPELLEMLGSRAEAVSGPLPPLVLLSLGVSALTLAGVAAWRGDALSQGCLAAALLGAWGGTVPMPGAMILSTAGAAALFLATLMHAWRLAFRDGLTGLSARRTLDARLRGLSGDYALAMVDVDHFKRFNDTYGHEAGDQVLRLVARHLERVPGATPFRYGGEEFALVFPGRTTADALPALEALRAAIAGYPFRVRGPRRPGDRRGQKRRGAGEGDHKDGGQRNDDKDLRVTVSIGVADPAAAGDDPLQVLAAADEALYRAKRGGRDRVARKGRRRTG